MPEKWHKLCSTNPKNSIQVSSGNILLQFYILKRCTVLVILQKVCLVFGIALLLLLN